MGGVQKQHACMTLVRKSGYFNCMRLLQKMPGDVCVVCGNSCAKDSRVSMHRIPRNQTKREKWIDALGLDEGALRDYHRVCSQHFLNADARHIPDITLGKHFLLLGNARCPGESSESAGSHVVTSAMWESEEMPAVKHPFQLVPLWRLTNLTTVRVTWIQHLAVTTATL